ncbi:MAG TPA: hypothetical protein VGM20_02735 [Gemmatimonadales bacterium]
MHRLRALAAILLFAGSDGAPQLADALLFHTGRQYHTEIVGVDDGQHCHAERCDLGATIASPPPLAPPDLGDRFEFVSFRVAFVSPTNPPRRCLHSAPVGSRAPPLFS